MYRLDDTVAEIVPGKMDQMSIDFTEPAKNRKYLFHKIRPTGAAAVAEVDKVLNDLKAGGGSKTDPTLRKAMTRKAQGSMKPSSRNAPRVSRFSRNSKSVMRKSKERVSNGPTNLQVPGTIGGDGRQNSKEPELRVSPQQSYLT